MAKTQTTLTGDGAATNRGKSSKPLGRKLKSQAKAAAVSKENQAGAKTAGEKKKEKEKEKLKKEKKLHQAPKMM